MSLDKKIIKEILDGFTDENYFGETREATKHLRDEIEDTICSKEFIKDFVGITATIYRKDKSPAIMAHGMLIIGIVIGMKYKEKELTKDASKRRLIT